MKRLLIAPGALLLAFGAAALASDAGLILQPLMQDVVAKQAEILWDVGNRGMDDNGAPDASALSNADWIRLTGAARSMKSAALSMVDAPEIVVSAPGFRLQDEGAPGAKSPAQIQGFIAQDRNGFSDHARALSAVSSRFLKAAEGHDAQLLFEASGQLDEACEGCHIKYWYPPE